MGSVDYTKKIDILDRQEFIDNILTIISSCKQQKQGTSFSVSGGWGIGKSFILDCLQENLSEEYIVLRYDSWKYDYYEEPLVALVSSIADQLLDDEGKVSSGIAATATKAAMQMAWECAVGLAGPYAFILKAAEKACDHLQKDKQKAGEYDQYSVLKKNLIAIRNLIKVLAGEKQVILMIDELDRCLPTYQIKVLERIHHIIADTPIIVIYALNPTQLSETIRQIYGGNDNRVAAYLKKFLHFSLKLDIGKVSDDVRKKYEQDISEFESADTEGSTETGDWFDKVCRQLLSELDVRTQEKLWEIRKIIHNIIFSKETAQLPQIFLTCELLLLVMNEWRQRAVVMPDSWSFLNWNDGIPVRALISRGFNNEQKEEKVKLLPLEFQSFWNDLNRTCSGKMTRFAKDPNRQDSRIYYSKHTDDESVCLAAAWTYADDSPYLQIKRDLSTGVEQADDVFKKLLDTMKQFNIFVKMMM